MSYRYQMCKKLQQSIWDWLTHSNYIVTRWTKSSYMKNLPGCTWLRATIANANLELPRNIFLLSTTLMSLTTENKTDSIEWFCSYKHLYSRVGKNVAGVLRCIEAIGWSLAVISTLSKFSACRHYNLLHCNVQGNPSVPLRLKWNEDILQRLKAYKGWKMLTCCRLLKSIEDPAETELTFTILEVTLSSNSDVSKKGAMTLTAHVSSYPSSDFCINVKSLVNVSVLRMYRMLLCI